jgi:serine/threonine protein kinase
MLYCPKCQKTYEADSQRFCSNEGEPLLSATSLDKFANQTNSVSTNILNQKSRDESGKVSTFSKSSQTESENYTRPNFRPPPDKIFENESKFELKSNLAPSPKTELKPPPAEQYQQLIELDDIFISPELAQGEKTDSTEAETFDFDSPNDLLGKTIKNRYQIIEQIGTDESGIIYLAKDKTNSGEKISLKVLFENEDETLTGKILAEERISLARIDHPNIVRVYDSGKLPDGKPFIVTEHIEGVTVKDYLEINEQFETLRVARIIRQSSDALGEAHQNNIPHRNLKPENILLIVDENGLERVKLTNFGAAKEKLSEHNLLYKPPEQVEGKNPNFTSDGYSLAVIAYQMLINRFPFDASSVGDLLKSQRESFQIPLSDVRSDLPPSVDDILRKALSFNSFDRYLKARDFGDDFFSEIIANTPPESEEFVTITNQNTETSAFSVPTLLNNEKPATEILFPIDDYVYTSRIQEKSESESVKAVRNLAWEKRSSERSSQRVSSRIMSSAFGIAVLIAALLGAWHYFINGRNQTFMRQPTETVNQNATTVVNPLIVAVNPNDEPVIHKVEPPPLRSIQPPPDSIYFENNVNNLKGGAAENFLGFSLYYPKDWTRKDAKNNFLDVSKVSKNDLPIEQMLVSYYNSSGTYDNDLEKFPALVKDTNATLKKIVPNYQLISEGKKNINNGWRAYEIKFQGAGVTAVGEKITLWGRRLFIPPGNSGMKNGYVLTMLATSLSEDVKSVEDVGVKGELSTILETFEPNRNF